MNKVVVRYDEWCRMGNRMFPYAFGKILAKEKQAEFYCPPLPNFQNTLTENSNIPPYLRNPLCTRGKYGNHDVNYQELLNHDGDVLIDSFLQKAEYYIPHLNDLRHWFSFSLPEGTPIQKPEKNEIVMHIRETDYANLGVVLNNNYYLNILKNDYEYHNDYRKVTIVTDNCHSPSLTRFKEGGAKVLSRTPVHTFTRHSDTEQMLDFVYMLFADTLILSQSTFCWWAGFLGKHSKVYYPVNVTSKGMWKATPDKDDADLFVPNSNFIKVNV